MSHLQGQLLLLPNLLGPLPVHHNCLPQSVDTAVSKLDGLIAESESEGRVYLKRFTIKKALQQFPIRLLNEHTTDQEVEELLLPILEGQIWGIVSDAGLPCIADPGARLVLKARQRGISINAFAGPSSVVLALMLSGLSAQRFSFYGYLPRKDPQRVQEIINLEKRSISEQSTIVFIEAPYRNKQILETLIKNLRPNTYLCVAYDLTLPTQEVITKKIIEWKNLPLVEIDKKPAIYLISAS
ncbi:MAG: hypothetical protein K0S74_1105 [Chlamydiales bacterium]|jgi:16S rRNA (cytidine1402-2'-O)-methyltransferase|nr:hypothetical protein [Chlamydiales bacterium]